MTTAFVATPIGILKICEDGGAILQIIECDSFVSDNLQKEVTEVLKLAVSEIERYFNGELNHFSFPIAFNGTDFQKAVWKACMAIPYGSTLFYSEIASIIGKPKASRAVGAALSQNRLLLAVPCHRVLAKGRLGGFRLGAETKALLLNLEKGNSI